MNIKIDKYIDKKNSRKLEVISLDNLWIINYISKSSYIFMNTYIFDNEEKKDNKLDVINPIQVHHKRFKRKIKI